MPRILWIDPKLHLDSRVVATMVGKDHKHLLRDIRNYCKDLDIGLVFNSSKFFTLSSYIDLNNKTRPCYLVTKEGCALIANKMIGSKGIAFTASYCEVFANMTNNNMKVGKENE